MQNLLLTFNDIAGINARRCVISKNLFTIHPNYFNAVRNLMRVFNSCPVFYFYRVNEYEVGVISLFDQSSFFYSHMLCG